MTDRNLQIEGEYCQELWQYCRMGIMDNRTDGDRLIANLIAALAADELINIKRFNEFFRKAKKELNV